MRDAFEWYLTLPARQRRHTDKAIKVLVRAGAFPSRGEAVIFLHAQAHMQAETAVRRSFREAQAAGVIPAVAAR